jgi:hypothetical protein
MPERSPAKTATDDTPHPIQTRAIMLVSVQLERCVQCLPVPYRFQRSGTPSVSLPFVSRIWKWWVP